MRLLMQSITSEEYALWTAYFEGKSTPREAPEPKPPTAKEVYEKLKMQLFARAGVNRGRE